MDAKIIEQMRAQLSDSHWCANDFKIDVDMLKDTNEPFFWMVRQDGTSLIQIGSSFIESQLQDESVRFNLLRNPHCYLVDITYYASTTCKIFYWDGIELKQITIEDMCTIFDNIWKERISQVLSEHPMEKRTVDSPLELVMSDMTREFLQQQLEYAKSIGDTSLQSCVNRIQHYTRRAVNHYVTLYMDFAERSFGFTEYVNEEPRLNGGIIYHSCKNETGEITKESWQIHT